MFDLSLFWQYKLSARLYFLEKAPYSPSVSCISMIGVKEISLVEEKEHFLTVYLGEVPDVLSINFYENYVWLLTRHMVIYDMENVYHVP